MKNANNRNDSTITWYFFFYILRRSIWVIILMPFAAVGLYYVLLPILGEPVSIVVFCVAAVISYIVMIPKVPH